MSARLGLAPAAVGIALATAMGAPAAPGAIGLRDPARVQVSADEFTLTLSRLRIKHGSAVVQMVNYGEDDHDLALRRQGGTMLRMPAVPPGEVGELEVSLRAGRYTLWCTLAGHRARGMVARLVVR